MNASDGKSSLSLSIDLREFASHEAELIWLMHELDRMLAWRARLGRHLLKQGSTLRSASRPPFWAPDEMPRVIESRTGWRPTPDEET
jgi:hypothetical protein